MSIRVLIIEDNPLTAQDLAEIIAENGMNVLGTCFSAEDALVRIPEKKPDVLLVDIKLRGKLTGIEMVEQLESSIPVIYLTSNSDRDTVQQALETHPASFLTKPFDDKDVVIAIELAFKSFNTSTSGETPPKPFVFLKSNNQYEKVQISEIQYLEADGSYCKVITKEKEYLLTGTMSHFCDSVDTSVIRRVHRSFAVNVNQISALGSDYLNIGETKIPVGRTYREDLKHIAARLG